MESDYYLHNFHVKSGAGVSMKTYRKAFGIDWNDNEDDGDYFTPSPRSKRTQSNLSRRHRSRENGRGDEESLRVRRVRSRCEAQKESLSVWWKHALQQNIKQRMWMQLGQKQADILLSPRFERVYEPDKLGQFDRFFSRSWATPVRRSHAAQHTEGGDDDSGDLPRWISSTPVPLKDGTEKATDAGYYTHRVHLDDFIDRYGHEPRNESNLRRFSDYHSKLTKVTTDSAYIGNIEVQAMARPEYIQYASGGAPERPQQYDAETIQEFRECLYDCTLGADDVPGIQKVSFSIYFLCFRSPFS